MTVIVTGATGHLGVNLLRALDARGERVRALGRTALPDGIPAAEFSKGDIRDRDFLFRAFKGGSQVFHLAAHISLSSKDWPRVEETNVMGTRNVVDACLECGVERLIHVSSIHALEQDPLRDPLDESRNLVDSSWPIPYDRSKAAAELEVKRGIEQGLDAVIVVPTGIIGPNDFRPSHMGQFLVSLVNGQMPALVRGGFDWVDVRDVASGVIDAANVGSCGSKYLLSGNWVSVTDLARETTRISGTSMPRLVTPLWLAHLGVPFAQIYAHFTQKRPLFTSVSLRALRSNRHISHEAAGRDFDYAPREFKQTLRDTLVWFEKNGYLKKKLQEKT